MTASSVTATVTMEHFVRAGSLRSRRRRAVVIDSASVHHQQPGSV
ncbi:MAG TPA: hypothetical protein VE196_09175 [Pseudonocardiaceae bacterium]|nr:hypothetical protein [Pseudonocardiaceae bacterium]